MVDTLKLSIGGVLAAIAFVLALAVPASAEVQLPPGGDNTTNVDVNCSVIADCSSSDDDVTITKTLSGNCNIWGDVNQENKVINPSQNNSSGDTEGGDAENENVGDGNASGDGGAANSSQTNNQTINQSNTVHLDCSVHNAAAAGGLGGGAPASTAGAGGLGGGFQVSAPAGGVGAGAGGAASSSISALIGLGASLSAVGAGLRLRKFEL